jgi:hypothetical protein
MECGIIDLHLATLAILSAHYRAEFPAWSMRSSVVKEETPEELDITTDVPGV